MDISKLSDEAISNLMDRYFYAGDSDIEDVIEEYGKKRWTTGGWGWYLVGPLMAVNDLTVDFSLTSTAVFHQNTLCDTVHTNPLRAICECILMIEMATD